MTRLQREAMACSLRDGYAWVGMVGTAAVQHTITEGSRKRLL